MEHVLSSNPACFDHLDPATTAPLDCGRTLHCGMRKRAAVPWLAAALTSVSALPALAQAPGSVATNGVGQLIKRTDGSIGVANGVGIVGIFEDASGNVWIGNTNVTAAPTLGVSPAAPVLKSYSYAVAFGAKCDGSTDDTAALSNWAASLGPGVLGVLPAGTCVFRSPLSIVANGFGIRGSGEFTTTLQYAGANTTPDIITIGNTASGAYDFSLAEFTITSATKMTAGTAIHIVDGQRFSLTNGVIEGQDNSQSANNLWNGIWFDKIDTGRWYGGQAEAQNVAVQINGQAGSGPKADLFMAGQKIGGANIGVLVGGAFGGLYLDSEDIISNGVDLKVDDSLAAEGNREIFVGPTVALDTATSGDNVYVNDGLSSGATLHLDAWVATGPAACVHVAKWGGGNVSIGGPVLMNCVSGLQVDDASANIAVSAETQIHNNNGYGVNATVPTTRLRVLGQLYANTSGGLNANAAASPIGVAGPLQLGKTPVAGLPACSSSISGAIEVVTDAISPTYNGPLTGGGSTLTLALCNGTAWTAH